MILAFLRALALSLIRLPVIILGLPVVWFALPKATSNWATAVAFSQYPQHGSWMLVRLPKWARLWDNAFDGMLGDKRGWWANDCEGLHRTRLNMWRWAALRNPANYFSRNICGVDVSKVVIVNESANGDVDAIPNHRGFVLLKGMAAGRKTYARFYAEYAFTKTHGLMIDIGWKIKTSHNGTAPDAPEKDRLKGIVSVISPWKEF